MNSRGPASFTPTKFIRFGPALLPKRADLLLSVILCCVLGQIKEGRTIPSAASGNRTHIIGIKSAVLSRLSYSCLCLVYLILRRKVQKKMYLEKACLYCKQKTRNKKFCSKSCSASYNNKHISRSRMKKQGRCFTCSCICPKRRKYCDKCFPLYLQEKKRKIIDRMEKFCPKCKIVLSIDKFSFSKSKKGFLPYCKSCYSEYVYNRYRDFKQCCVDYKGGKCEKCGYDKCLAAMEFHHLDKNTKDFEIGKLRFTSWWKNKDFVIRELDKCQLLCSNCHKEEHSLRESNPEPSTPLYGQL